MKWISVKDELPKETGHYLIMHTWHGRTSKDHTKVMHFLHTAYETPVMMWYDTKLHPLVTHWMPLPQPPTTDN
jgi:hypothetical protein